MDEYSCLKLSCKGKLKWIGDFENLQALINQELGLQTKWTTPSGGSKLFENDEVSIRWYTNTSTLMIKGKESENIKRKLSMRASNEADTNDDDEVTEDEDNHGCQFEASLDEDDPIIHDLNQTTCTYLEQKIDHLSAVFTKSIDEVKRDVDSLKERESRNLSRENEIIAALRQENQELKAENSSLRDKVTNLSLITSDLNNKVKENENERLSLVTAIKLIQTDLRPREFQHDWQQQTKSVAEHTHGTDKNHTHKGTAAKQPANYETTQASNHVNADRTESFQKQGSQCPDISIQNSYSVLNVEETSDSRLKPTSSSATQNAQNRNDNRECEIARPTNQNSTNAHGRRDSESGTNIVLVGDSMVKNINPRKLSRKRVSKFTFPGKRAEEIAYEVKNISIHDQPTHVIIHAGTNNLPTDTSEQCIKNIKGLCISVKQRFPNAKLGISSIISRKDIDVSGITRQVNNQMKHICDESGYTFIDNSIIDESGLNNSKLHLSPKGSALLATRFIKFINPSKQPSNRSQGNPFTENFIRDLLNIVALTQTSQSRRRTR